MTPQGRGRSGTFVVQIFLLSCLLMVATLLSVQYDVSFPMEILRVILNRPMLLWELAGLVALVVVGVRIYLKYVI